MNIYIGYTTDDCSLDARMHPNYITGLGLTESTHDAQTTAQTAVCTLSVLCDVSCEKNTYNKLNIPYKFY